MAVPLPGITQDGDHSDSNSDSDGENSTGLTCFPLSDTGLPEGPPEELPEIMPQEQSNGLSEEQQEEQVGEKRGQHQEQEQGQEQEAKGHEDGKPAATERREIDQYITGQEDNGLANHALRAVPAADVEPLSLPRPLLHQHRPEPKQRQKADIAGTSPSLDAAEDQENRRGAMQRSAQEQQQQQQHAHWPRRRGRRGGVGPRNPVRRILDDYRNHGCSDNNCGSSGHGHRVGTPAWPAERGVLVPADPNPPFSEGLFRHKRRELCCGIWGVPYDLIARCLVGEVDSLWELRS